MHHLMTSLVVLCLAAFLAALLAQVPPSPSRSIFREVTFAPYDAIRLGETTSRNAPAGEPRGTDRIVLPAGFGGTGSITLQFDRNNRVIAMHFAYPTAKDYPAFVANYLTSLGAPVSRASVDSARGQRERIVWEDPNTRFEIVRYTRHSHTLSLVSHLIDLKPKHH